MASLPNPLPFDPAGWLRRFEAAGGWYAVTSGKVVFGWCPDPEDRGMRARYAWHEIGGDQALRDAVSDHVRSLSMAA